MTRPPSSTRHPSSWFLLFLFLILMSPALARAEGDSITLKNGQVVKGHIAAWNDKRTEIYFVPEDRKAKPQWMPLTGIKAVHFAGAMPKSKARGIPAK